MKTKEIIENRLVKAVVDKRLDQYSDKILFPKKVGKVTRLLKNVSPPPKF